MFRFQKLVAMITPDFYFVKRFFMGPFAARVQRVQKVQRVQRVVVAAPPMGGHFVARVQRVQKVLPAFGRRVQRVVVSPYRAMSLYAVEVLHRTFKSVEAGP